MFCRLDAVADVGGQLTATAHTSTASAVIAVHVADDGSLTFATYGDDATVYRRVGQGVRFEAVYRLKAAIATLPNPGYPISLLTVDGAAIDPARRRVFLDYHGGVIGVPLDPAVPTVHIPRPRGPLGNAVGVDDTSGTLFIADDRRVAAYDPGGRQLFDAEVPRGMMTPPAAASGRDLVAVVISEGTRLPSVCHLLRASTGESVARLPLDRRAAGKSVAVSPDGSRIAAVTGYGERTRLKVWRLADVLP